MLSNDNNLLFFKSEMRVMTININIDLDLRVIMNSRSLELQ